jgi:undecaprenyl-diphosphatase
LSGITRLQLKSRLLEIDSHFTGRLRVAEKPGILRSLAILFAHSGDSWFWLVGLTILWWWGTEPWKWRSFLMGASILVTAALVLAIKLIVRRQRPAGEWGAIYRKTDPHSFPSGHAARAALLAALAFGIGPTWFGLVLLVWAPLVILARVAMGVHYLSDVLAGAFLGLMVGLGVLSVIRPFAFPF